MSLYKTSNKSGGLNVPAFFITLLVMSTSATVSAGINEEVESTLKLGQADAKYGRITFDTRLRYENVNTQHTTTKAADAFTARFRIGYLSPKVSGFQGFAEFEGNQDIGINDYRNKRNGSWRKNQYDVIQDP